ncbi:ATP-dependent translocase ABCB1 [Condylostylus longicornis]|uniref:ATP-dependent translocase ABCB1 n=1 Tax=Condylostylus longicornis TaxID=2530218 RepID=UPI00244DDE8D|nr:ATP-dependent translocase ABCB1 [Condylostylus longicornis]
MDNGKISYNEDKLKDTALPAADKIPDKEILKDTDQDDKTDSAPPISFFKLYKYSTWNDRFLIIIGIACAVATGLTAPAHTLIFGDLADAMIEQGGAIINGTATDFTIFLDSIQKFAMFNSIIGAVMLICSYVSVTTFNYAAHSQIFTIRGIYFRSILNQDIEWFDFNQSGEFGSRMNEDLTKMEDGLGEKVVMFIHYVVAFIGCISLALGKGWLLALACLASLPITMASMGVVAIITSRLSKKEVDEYAKAGSIAEETFSGIRTVMAFGGEQKEVNRYKKNLVVARKVNQKKGFFSGLGFGLLWFFIYGSYGLAFWYGVGLVLDEKDLPKDQVTYTAGVMMTVFFSVMMGSMNLGVASPYIESFGVAKGAGAKIFQLIESIPKINPLLGKGEIPDKVIGNIEFRNVHFQYPSRPDVKVLQGLSLNIQRGETVALVGSSGCGKSTCIQLLQRFYDPADGQILIDNNDIKELNVNWLRSHIGSVGQEPVLFGTTVYENIRYGREDATREEIENAAKASNAHIFIKKLPKGYDTLVGERGAQLSGGQKQRIAIARALIRNPEILLLDEATSALDTASEAKVQEALEKASMGRTTIIIAHRLTTIRNADKIVVINKGQVVEIGNHSELMELKGHYFQLITSQIGEDVDDGRIRTPSVTTVPTFKAITPVDEDEEFTFDADDEDEELDKKKKKEGENVSLLEIIKLNQTEWPHIVVGSVTAIIIGCTMPLFAVIFGDILQILSYPDNDYVRSQTNTYCLYFVLCGIVTGLATFLQIYSFTIAGEILTERLRGMAFSAMLRQEIAWFDNKANGTGTLCARLSNDAAAVQGATGQRVGIILQSIATILLAVILSMYYEFKLGLLALAFTPFILVATFLQRRVQIQENMGSSKAMESCTKLAIEVVSSVRTVVSLGREQMFYSQYVALLEPAVTSAKKMTHFRGFVYGLARSLMFFAFAACMFYGGHLVAYENLEYGKVFKVSQALIMGSVSVANALAFAPNFQKGLTAAGHIFALLRREPKIQDPLGTAGDMKIMSDGNVVYENIKFRYPTRKHYTVFNDLNLEVTTGQTVALVGPSGCGKSTCLQLLQRFYDAENGKVLIDKRDIKTMSLRNVRSQLGSVSQEPMLFDRTVAENIAYGDNERQIDILEIIEAARKANIHNFITSLPMGYETRLGEKGTQLSGGQKQRIAIARALIRNPKILLLDEATSALDAESEKIVQEALESAREGRTCITIAHRLSTIIDSDIIFVLDGGEVIEKGTHAELIKKRGLYFSLYKLQSGQR